MTTKRAKRIYNAVCAHCNVKRPNLGHYATYCREGGHPLGKLYDGMITIAQNGVMSGNTNSKQFERAMLVIEDLKQAWEEIKEKAK